MSRKTLTHNDNDNPKKSDVDTDIDLAYTQGCTAVGGGNTSPTTKMYEFYHLLPTVRIFSHCLMHGIKQDKAIANDQKTQSPAIFKEI